MSKIEDNIRDLDKLIDLVNEYTKTNIRAKGRQKEVILAKKAFCYVARVIGKHGLQRIGNSMGVSHDTVMHHVSTSKQWIENGDSELIDCINGAYDLDIMNVTDPKDIRLMKLEQRLKDTERLEPFLHVLRRVPEGKESEVISRLELFLKGYEFSNSFTKTKEYTALGSEMVGVY